MEHAKYVSLVIMPHISSNAEYPNAAKLKFKQVYGNVI